MMRADSEEECRSKECGTPTSGATKPRTSMGYTATLALLQESITAVNSDCRSGVKGKPAVSMMRVLRPGTAAIFFARLRSASITVCAPKSASALSIDSKDGMDGPPPKEATSTGGCALGETADPFTPFT